VIRRAILFAQIVWKLANRLQHAVLPFPGNKTAAIGSFVIPASRKIMLRVFHGLAFSVSQSFQHLRGRFPADLSIRPQIPHCITSLFELGQDLGDESMPALGDRPGFSLLACDIDLEFQRFGQPEFHMFAFFLAPLAIN
jgi:hypothetical protein